MKLTKILIAIASAAAMLLSCNRDGETEFQISSSRFSVDASAQTVTVTITTGADWSIAPNTGSTWLSASPGSGSAGTSTITINVQANGSSSSRTGTLTLSTSGTYLITVQQAASGATSKVNEWIYGELSDDYYWNEAVKAANPNYNLAYGTFLENLLVNLDDARDDDGTIDGGYNANGTRYIYSYIERSGGTRAEGEEQTFGFGFEAFWADDARTYLWLLVTWTQPGGPAESEGLKRGMWITQYNGAQITENAYYNFVYQLYYMQGGTRMQLSAKNSLTAAAGQNYTLDAVTMEVTPVIYDDIITTTGGKKVGYLVYNAFERGANTGSGYSFDNQLRSVFGEFGAEGVTELVLDLRYNGGGYVNSCQILTSLIANTTSSNIFAKLLYNSSYTASNPYVMRYLAVSGVPSLSRVIVLAKGDSASASEMVISSLRGIKGDNYVIHIGETTEGKNVGMDLYRNTIDGYTYEMYPITFKILNALDYADYADGLDPTYKIDEYRNRETGIYELGNPNEELLKAALTVIDGGQPVVDTRSVASFSMRPELPRIGRRWGAWIVPSEMEGMERR